MEDLTKHRAIMADVITWAGDSSDKWAVLLEAVKGRYVPTLPFSLTKLTPREVLLNWTGNRYDYSRGVANDNGTDISFYERIVSSLERSVPMALSLDPGMAETFMLKIKASKKGKKGNSVMELEELWATE